MSATCEKCENCDVDQKLSACKTEIGQQVEQLNSKMCGIEKDISELVSIFRASKGFVRVVGNLGKGIRFTAMTAAAIGALWLTLKAAWHAAIALLR